MKESIEYLITNCRKGKRFAQLALYNRYAKKLYVTCLRITGNIPEAEEAMQDSFLKIFTKLEQYKPEQSFEAWIHKIAIHTAIDYVRRQDNNLDLLTENYPDMIEEEKDDENMQYNVAQIKEAIKKLSPGYRIILSLYLFEGYDMEEISSILTIQPVTVRSQYLRAKRKLIEIITKS